MQADKRRVIRIPKGDKPIKTPGYPKYIWVVARLHGENRDPYMFFVDGNKAKKTADNLNARSIRYKYLAYEHYINHRVRGEVPLHKDIRDAEARWRRGGALS